MQTGSCRVASQGLNRAKSTLKCDLISGGSQQHVEQQVLFISLHGGLGQVLYLIRVTVVDSSHFCGIAFLNDFTKDSSFVPRFIRNKSLSSLHLDI